MSDSILPQKVADAFLEQYYPILKHRPEQAYRFYNDSSLLGWEGSDGLVTPVTTLSGIKDKIMSSDFRNCSIEILTADSQATLGGGLIVAVSGLSTWNNDVKKDFNQTFFLAKQEKVYFVLNDILRFSKERRELKTASVANENNKQDQAASSAPNAVATTVSDSHVANNESVAKKKHVKQGLDPSVVKDTDYKASSSTSNPSSPSLDKAPLGVEPVSVVGALKPVEAPKISYASMVTKVSPLASPKEGKISSNAGNRVIPPPSINKASSTPSNAATKASTSHVAPKSFISANEVPNTYARVIYIANLPCDVTKNRIAEVMKKFGQVRRTTDSIQFRSYEEDGFTYGFVEFESADGAFRAVEARNVQFGDKNAYITYKKRPNSGGNNGRGRSPPRDGFRDDNFRGYENGESGTVLPGTGNVRAICDSVRSTRNTVGFATGSVSPATHLSQRQKLLFVDLNLKSLYFVLKKNRFELKEMGFVCL